MSPAQPHALSLMLVIALSAACGMPGTQGTQADAGAGGGGGGWGEAGDGGQTEDAGTGGGGGAGGAGGAPDSGAPTKLGLIRLSQSCAGASCLSQVTAGFWTDWVRIFRTPRGGCVLETRDVGPPGTIDSAGDVTIAGLLGGPIGLPLPNGPVVYAQLWQPGATLSASATGDDVPPFVGKTVIAPNTVTVTAPACGSGHCGNVSQSGGLTVSWTGAPNGVVTTRLLGTHVTAVCRHSASPAVIPKEVLYGVFPLGIGSEAAIKVCVEAQNLFQSGDYDIEFTALNCSLEGTLTAVP